MLLTFATLAMACAMAEDTPVLMKTPPSQVEITEDRVFFGSESGLVSAYDKQSGEQLWTFQKEGRASNKPLYHEGLVLTGGFDGILHALDAETGEVKWAFEAGKVSWKFRDKFINGYPTVEGDRVVFSSEDYNVYCLNVKTGIEIWRRKLGEEPQAFEHPIVDGAVLVGAWDGHLYSLDMKDGSVRWKSETEFMPRGKTVWRDGRNLYDRAHGEEKWLKSEQAPHLTCVPAVDASHIYVSRWSGELIALDRKTGKQVWRFAPDTKDTFDAGGRFYVIEHDGVVTYGTSDDGHIFGLDAKTGKVKWNKDTGSPIFGPMPGIGGIAIYAKRAISGLGVTTFDIATGETITTFQRVTSLPTHYNGLTYFSQLTKNVKGFVITAVDLKSGESVWTLSKKAP